MSAEDDFRLRPGRVRDRGRGHLGRLASRKPASLAAQVRRAAARSGRVGPAPHRRAGRSTGARGRGRTAALQARFSPAGRRVVIKARVVRHTGARFRSTPLARHLAYLKREGVARDGRGADLFDAGADRADGEAFAARCGEDRHHFRFTVSPEDAGEMADLRAFAREFMQDMAKDLETPLDWVAAEHWNTDNPHLHILVRGRLADGEDLVIDKDYIRAGMRWRAESRATLELGPRSERELSAALDREVDADRWTSLDARLERMAEAGLGLVDLRPGAGDPDPASRGRLIGRAAKLERLGLAEPVAPAAWRLATGLETTLREIGERGDIIKTLHRAMGGGERPVDLAAFALHGRAPADPIVGRLVERGLHDELAGTAYAVIAGVDGRSHHVRFEDLERTGDAQPGAVVEVRSWVDARGRPDIGLIARSDLPLAQQISAPGATWLDRQLVAREPVVLSGGFGLEVREAMDARAESLIEAGLARREGQRLVFARDLLARLRHHHLASAAEAISQRTGLAWRAAAEGEPIAGVYRERVTLSSGRFAMIDDGLGFQLVPWRAALEPRLGRQVSGVMGPGGIDWSLGRKRGLGL